MSPIPSSTSPNTPEVGSQSKVMSPTRRRTVRTLVDLLLVIGVGVAWLLLNAYNNNANPTVTGRPLSNLWFSSDIGTTWVHRWHFDRGDLVSLIVNPQNPYKLYAGFFLPPKVVYSTDGGSSWQTLTD